jgi:hypothetical protein
VIPDDGPLEPGEFVPEDAGLPARVEDIRSFFKDPRHWVYTSKGTPSDIRPTSIYHITQLQVLFEDRYFHTLTYRALQRLIDEGFLRFRHVTDGPRSLIVVWRHNLRYVERPIQGHLKLTADYSHEVVSKATGRYAETLVSFGLRTLGLRVITRNSRQFRDRVWTSTQHDLDFVLEGPTGPVGVEVKNTFDYMAMNEFNIKLDMCQHLGLTPLFIVRSRDNIRWQTSRERGGLMYMFKSKVFPPGYEELVGRIWREMRLPVAIWDDWRPQFYTSIADFLAIDNPSL